MANDNTLFGTQAKTFDGVKVIVLSTFQNKYADTDWFTSANVILDNGKKTIIKMEDLIFGWD